MKFDDYFANYKAFDVAPLVGAWIEISYIIISPLGALVAPLVGAWIEIKDTLLSPFIDMLSLPSWERGLKFDSTSAAPYIAAVAPLVGAWIEIQPC